MKPYSEYKDSGVEWIAKTPSHWNLKRNKHLFYIEKETVGDKFGDFNLLSLGKSGVSLRDIDSGKGKFPESFETYQMVDPDDLIFCLFDLDETPRTIGISNLSGMITGAYTVVKCTPIAYPKFLFYYYLAIDNQKGLRPYYTGLRKVVRTETFINIPVEIPPLPEQTQIANFLDTKTQQIDQLIQNKQQKIKLLQEKRTAVINQAVTKGLTPDVEMKDSGVEWVGEMPAHWKTTRLKFATTHIVDCPHSTPIYSSDGDYHVIRTADVSPGRLSLSNTLRVNLDEYLKRIERLKPQAGDIVYSREGERFAMAALVPKGVETCLGQRMMHFRASSDFNTNFLMWQLNADSTYCQAQQDTTGATSPRVNVSTIINFHLAKLPLSEQCTIADFLDEKKQQIDDLISKEQRKIELLKEYRQSLISDAVTGKIDVRDVV